MLYNQVGNQTDQALAQLYAHVQSMPESAHKRRLVSKLNEANGRGTPEVATSGSVRTIGRMARTRRKSGDGFINLLTPRRKRPVTGSYSVKSARTETHHLEHSHSFRRQNSLAAPASGPGAAAAASARTLSPATQSSPAVLSPYRDRLPSPPPTGETPVSQASEVCPVDEVDTPGKETDEDTFEDELDTEDEELPDHDGSYTAAAPPLPPRTPNPANQSTVTSSSTITSQQSVQEAAETETMSPISLAITTPRHRGGLMLCSRTQLDRWRLLLDSQQSPCQPQHYNEDEPEEGGEVADADPDRVRASAGANRNRSLSSEFKEFLASHGMEAADESEASDGSLLETSATAASYSEEVRKLLGREAALSTSLQAAMDGEDPVLAEITNTANTGAQDKDTISAKTAPAPASQAAEDTENSSPQPRRGVKRRSITEAGPQTAANIGTSVQNTAIIFETDL